MAPPVENCAVSFRMQTRPDKLSAAWAFSPMFVFRGRDGLRAVRLMISGPRNEEKNGTAQRPSLPEMNEFLVGRVAEARCSAFVKPL
jgi:hypothetical protein